LSQLRARPAAAAAAAAAGMLLLLLALVEVWCVQHRPLLLLPVG
jgi:hypothetical protein